MEWNSDAKNFLGVGFKFPIQVDRNTGRVKTSSFEEDIKEAILIILKTRKGQRVMRPDFGCDIYDYVFQSMDYNTISKMEHTVYEALALWEPRIRDVKVSIDAEMEQEGQILVHIDYVVRNTNNPYNLVYPFYIEEGLGAGEDGT